MRIISGHSQSGLISDCFHYFIFYIQNSANKEEFWKNYVSIPVCKRATKRKNDNTTKTERDGGTALFQMESVALGQALHDDRVRISPPNCRSSRRNRRAESSLIGARKQERTKKRNGERERSFVVVVVLSKQLHRGSYKGAPTARERKEVEARRGRAMAAASCANSSAATVLMQRLPLLLRTLHVGHPISGRFFVVTHF